MKRKGLGVFDASLGGVRKRRGQAQARRRATLTRMQIVQFPPPGNARTGGFLGLERKFADFQLTNTAFGTSWVPMQDGTIKCISGVAQGDGESERDGRLYTLTSLHIRGFIEILGTEGQTAPLGDHLARVVIVLDTQTNAAEVTATNVMDAGQTDDINSFRNLQFTKRFRVLKDKTFRIPGQAGSMTSGANVFDQGPVKIHFKWNFNFKTPIRVICKATTNVIGAITDNSIQVIGVGDTALTLLNYQARVRFLG